MTQSANGDVCMEWRATTASCCEVFVERAYLMERITTYGVDSSRRCRRDVLKGGINFIKKRAVEAVGEGVEVRGRNVCISRFADV